MQTTVVIMCEQVKSLDISVRKATFFEQAPKDEVMSIPVEFTDTTIRLEDAIIINEGRPVYGDCHQKL